MTDEELKRLDFLRGAASGNVHDEWKPPNFEDGVHGPEFEDGSISLYADDGTEVCNFGRNNKNRAADAEFVAVASHKFRDLIDEVRRLREVVKGAERSGDSFPSGGCPACPWCGSTASVSRKEPHADSCPAFTPDGTVR